MNLSPMQLFYQEKILLALYPWLSIEEARENEFEKHWCIVKYYNRNTEERWEGLKLYNKIYTNWNFFYCDIYKDILYIDWDGYRYSIIGLPPTLPRVLEALGDFRHIYYNWIIWKTSNLGIARWTTDWITKWKLLNEDKTDATLRDQGEQTQLAIAKLLGREE